MGVQEPPQGARSGEAVLVVPVGLMKYRKRPIVVEAFQMTEEVYWEGCSWPEWLYPHREMPADEAGAIFESQTVDILLIRTLEGVVRVFPNDYIVRSENGDLTVVNPKDFEATYEVVVDEFQAGFARGLAEGPSTTQANKPAQAPELADSDYPDIETEWNIGKGSS